MEHHPIVHVAPREIKYGSPIYLTYTHAGCGHYDAVVDSTPAMQIPSTEDAVYCTCGKNTSRTGIKKELASCVPIKSKYTSIVRCSLKEGRECTSLCSCIGCGNGKKRYEAKPPRKRQRHAYQVASTKSSVFGINEGEDLSLGTRTLLEFFVLEGVSESPQ